jgi:hypothetical protein
LVQGVFDAVFDGYTEHQFLVFCTPFNRSLLVVMPNTSVILVCPLPGYFQDLDYIAAKEDLQILFRSYPSEDTLQSVERKAYCLFVPPRLSVLPQLEKRLGWLPLGGQYWVEAKRSL